MNVMPTGFWQNPTIEGLLAYQDDQPLYLTNGSGESAHGSQELFDWLGLSSDCFAADTGHFYPLTERESHYVQGDDALGISASKNVGVWMGYSTVFQGKKYFSPNVMLFFDANNETDEANQARRATALHEKLQTVLRQQSSGFADCRLSLNEEDDKHTIVLLIPPRVAFLHDGYHTYTHWLRCTVEQCLEGIE